MDEWDRAAWIAAHIPRFGGEPKTFEDFQPLRKLRRTASARSNLAAFTSAAQALRGKLPASLTNAEIEQRWREFVKRTDRTDPTDRSDQRQGQR